MKNRVCLCIFAILMGFVVSSCSNQSKSASAENEDNNVQEEGTIDVPNSEDEEFEADVPEEGFKIEAIDLGLSVLWANANIGANSIYETGDYYAWGESSTKSSYTLDNYFDYYIEVKEGGYVYRGFKVFNKMGQSLVGTEYDTAHNLLGGKWRMPTSDEYNELIRNCKITKTFLKNEKGNPLRDENGNIPINYNYVEVVGPNGNKIVFPYGGEKEADDYIEREGYYWTANMFRRGSDFENAMAASLGNYLRGPMALVKRNRGLGFNIRAVMDRGDSEIGVKDSEDNSAVKMVEEFYKYYIKNYPNLSQIRETVANKYLTKEYSEDYMSYISSNIDLLAGGTIYTNGKAFGGTIHSVQYIGDDKVKIKFNNNEGGIFTWIVTVSNIGSGYLISNVEVKNE